MPRTPTHQWKDRESIINLTFASKDIAACITYYKINKDLNYDSDHLLITLAVNWSL